MKTGFLFSVLVLSLLFCNKLFSAAIPVANFTTGNTSICEGQCINFTDLSANNPTSWSWSFQGASILNSSQQHPSNVCYNTAGTYFVSLTVSNASGSNTLYIAGYISVYPSSVVNLLVNGNFNNYNTGFNTPLTYVPTGGMSPDQYSIDTNAYFHNGNWAAISPDTTPFFMCDGSLTSGTTVWSESLTNIFPSSAYTFSFLMTNLDVNHSFVQPELLTTVTDQAGTILFTGSTGLLPAANSNVPPVYVWTTFGYVFTTLTNTTSITITVSQVGGVYLGFDFGLEDMSLKTHFCDSLAALPLAGLFTDENTICPGNCSDFLNLSQRANSYQWFFPGANPSLSNDINPQGICYNVPGTYDVTLIATNASGSDSITLPGYITVLPYPAPQGILQAGDSLIAFQGAVSYQWYADGVLISGATNYFYIATGSGNFSVVATDLNGCEVEAVIYDVVAGLNQLTLVNRQIIIFPNPVSETMEIRLREEYSSHVTACKIFNVIGEIVYSTSIPEQTTIDCRNFTPGIYLLEIITESGNIRAPFVKQ